MALPAYSGPYEGMAAYYQKSSALQMQMLENAVANSAPRGIREITSTGGGSSSSSSSSSSGGLMIPVGGVGGGSAGGTTSNLDATYDPWSKYRAGAGDQLAEAQVAGDPSNFYKQKLQSMSTGTFSPDDPSYQFRFQQGQQATERSLAAKGLLNSGNAALELQQYGQQAASQEYGAQFDRMLKGLSGVSTQYDTQMNRLMQMAGVGADPTGGAKVGVAQTSNAIDAMKANQTYDLGSRGLLQNAQQVAYGGNSTAASILSSWF